MEIINNNNLLFIALLQIINNKSDDGKDEFQNVAPVFSRDKKRLHPQDLTRKSNTTYYTSENLKNNLYTNRIYKLTIRTFTRYYLRMTKWLLQQMRMTQDT